VAESAAISLGLHPVIGRAVCEVLALEHERVTAVDSTGDAIATVRGFGSHVKRVLAVIDSSAVPKMEQAVDSLRAAAAPRQVDVIALLPPDADATPAHGVNRVLVKPLCTADLASQAAADTAQSTRVRVLPKSGSRGRALVVEDNAVNQEMARAMLDMLGFNVTTASNGREGVLAAAADRELDLILMDCQMPVMDGLAAARAIRESETDGARVAIVALTGNAMPGDREACVAAGMDDYLAKPFSLTALKAMIDKWTGSPTPAGAAAGVTTRKS
jgi:CheY-like chemotaxis protein